MKRFTVIAILMLAIPLLLGAEWVHTEKENLMAGTVSRTAVAFAEVSQGTLNDVALGIRKTGNSYEVFLFWGGYTMDRDIRSVTYRIGEHPVARWSAALSTNNEATFLTKPVSIIEQLRRYDGDKLVVQAPRSTGVMSVARIDLTGISDALAELEEPE